MNLSHVGSVESSGRARWATARLLALPLVALVALGIGASSANAAPLSMEFTEARANVGVQLDDAALFAAPATAPFAAEIDPASGFISGGLLTVPQFSTHITEPLNADVAVDFEIGVIDGLFSQATGALTLSGTAGGTLTSEGSSCTVATVPAVLTLTTAGNSGGDNPRSGTPFMGGLAGSGAIAGQWTDMTATPVTPDDETVCNTVDDRIGGPGGVWLQHQGDIVPPAAPVLTGTDPASPGQSGSPRIRGAAEAGSTVKIFAGPNCTGTLVAAGTAAVLGSSGIAVNVAEGVTASFSATATDPVGNSSPCSAPIAYTHAKKATPPTPKPKPRACVVPKLVGKTLKKAKKALKAANCKLGTVQKPKKLKDKNGKKRALVVKSSTPRKGARPADRTVDLKLGPKPRKAKR